MLDLLVSLLTMPSSLPLFPPSPPSPQLPGVVADVDSSLTGHSFCVEPAGSRSMAASTAAALAKLPCWPAALRESSVPG